MTILTDEIAEKAARAGVSRRDLERLLSKVMPEPMSGCWLWTGSVVRAGHPSFNFNGKTSAGHRVAYMAFKGVIPRGMSVCHRCDTPCCVNPDHLWLGTHAENMRDMSIKGRGHRGELTPQAKITAATVIHIRQRLMSARKYAAMYGVHQNHINDIQRGKRWAHIRSLLNKEDNANG